MIAGNHDYNKNVTAQVAYTNKSHRWYMPDLYYTEVVPSCILYTLYVKPNYAFQIITIPHSNSTIQFVFIDTVLLTDRNQSCSPPNDVFLMNAHWTWLENTLAASTAEWLFVLGHYPGENSEAHIGIIKYCSPHQVKL